MSLRKEINKDFFKKWTPKMAYALGFFVADGNMVITKRGGRYLTFYSADKHILIEIKKHMDSGHRLSKRRHKGGDCFRIQIGSKEMFEDLIKIGITPNKSRRMR